ncbi:phage tail protein [Cupriavidus basilensis]|uniref:phage tail protein n=1 Tax=Cupriavidus basilensis TaxID=68895 RepID=UPI0020A6D6DC|nr:phage tail protein [Cupriavidus basilensis]MCP3022311.1 phage tail protein [Cupriavidus basilensis]
MPQVIPLVIVAVGTVLGTSTLVMTVVSLAASLLFAALARKSGGSLNGFAAEAQGRTQIVRSNVQPRNIIYGRAMTSGPLVFAASTDGNGKANQFMHLVIALADHECDAIEEVYLGEDAVGPLDGGGYPVMGRFFKTWGESRTKTFTVPAGATSMTFSVGESIRNINSIVAVIPAQEGSGFGDTRYPLNDYSWNPGGDTVTVRGIPDGSLVITYEAQRSRPLVRIKKHLGSPDQGADGDLVNEVPGWTWDHRLRGVCYLYVRLEYDTDVFPNGLPNVKAVVRGKRVLDPRDGTVSWSNNWALCVYDYLRDERGFGCTDADIDVASVITAVGVSNESVAVAGGYQLRYRCDGVVMSDKSPRDNLTELTTAGAGAVVLSGGVFRVFAGSYDIPTVTLTESDLRGSIKVQPRMSRKDLFNVVKGTFVDPSKYWQPGDFPAVRNALYAAQDGEVIERDIELPYTVDSVAAQRLAKIILERSRQGIVVEFPAKLTAFQLTAYSTVKLTLAKFGWTNKVFRVMSWKMSADGGIDLVLNEEAAAVYDWNMGNATTVDPAPDTNLPNPFLVENLGQIRLESGTDQLILSQSGVVTSRMLASWEGVQEVSLVQSGWVELQYKRADQSEWTGVPQLPASATFAHVSPVEDGAPYVVRGRVVSRIGVRSREWTYSPVHTVVGKLSPPANLTGLSMTVLNGFANLTWDVATDLDVRNGGQARIRHTTDMETPTWGSAIDIGGYISGAANSAQLPLLEGVYLAKWIDSTGHESPTAAEVMTTAPSLVDLNVVATITEHPTFAGGKDGIVLDRALNGIKLIGRGLIDDQGQIDASGLWDDQPKIDSLGPIDTVVGSGGWGLIDSLGGIVASGTYTFSNAFDLGTVEKSRLTAAIDALSFDTGDLIDFRTDPMDKWQSFDGDRVSDTAVSLYLRTTRDDPAGSPAWSTWQRFSMGDYEARAFQWKVDLESNSPTHNVVVTGLAVTVDMPDRRELVHDAVSPAGPMTITFQRPFRAMPFIGVTAQNMVEGDYFQISGKTLAGYTLQFFNKAGASISRRFDAEAVSY